MLADDIADRIAIACPAELDGIVRDMWVDHTNGRLTEDEMEVLDEAARARREAIQARRAETRSRDRAPRKPRQRASHGDEDAGAVAARSISSRMRKTRLASMADQT